jgi:hypothetical protein
MGVISFFSWSYGIPDYKSPGKISRLSDQGRPSETGSRALTFPEVQCPGASESPYNLALRTTPEDHHCVTKAHLTLILFSC